MMQCIEQVPDKRRRNAGSAVMRRLSVTRYRGSDCCGEVARSSLRSLRALFHRPAAAGLQAGGQEKLKFSARPRSPSRTGIHERRPHTAGRQCARGELRIKKVGSRLRPAAAGLLRKCSRAGGGARDEARQSLALPIRSWAVKKGGARRNIRIERGPMKKLIPLVLGVWVIALVGCTTTAPSTTTTTTTRQTNATVDPTLSNSRTTQMSDRARP
jgi:hypothetical protein